MLRVLSCWNVPSLAGLLLLLRGGGEKRLLDIFLPVPLILLPGMSGRHVSGPASGLPIATGGILANGALQAVPEVDPAEVSPV